MKLSEIYVEAAKMVAQGRDAAERYALHGNHHLCACPAVIQVCLERRGPTYKALHRFREYFRPAGRSDEQVWFGKCTTDNPVEDLERNQAYRVTALLLMAQIVEGEEA